MKHTARLSKALEEFLKLDHNIALTTVQLFFVIASFPGRTTRFYCDYTGQSQSSVSRNVAALGKQHRLKKADLDLVEATSDPEEPRRYILTLTPKGKRMADTIETLMGG